jgi:uncharacterized protein (DUF433 family)
VGLGSFEDAATATLWRSHVLTRISRLGLVGKIRMAALHWSQCPAVESVPGKVGGAWVFRGIRMPVATVFENLEAGATVEETRRAAFYQLNYVPNRGMNNLA